METLTTLIDSMYLSVHYLVGIVIVLKFKLMRCSIALLSFMIFSTAAFGQHKQYDKYMFFGL